MTEPEPEPEPEPEQSIEDDPSHFTPDVICPFCHHNVKQHKEGCVGKRFPKSAKDREENTKRLRELYKNR